MDSAAVRLANERLWAAHPEIGRRQLTTDPADSAMRAEWMRYYRDASTATPPPPAVTPSPAPPPAPASAVVACPAAPKPVSISDCKQLKDNVKVGDIVLRGERGDSESEFISKISKCDYSHAGIVARNEKGELVVVDAYPGRGAASGDKNKRAVGANSVDDFFCNHGATQGLVSRPKDCGKSGKAAQWALEQTKDPDYTFNLFDPWNTDPKRLYCADFVNQSFSSAGVELVPNKMDFLSTDNKDNTFAQVRSFDSRTRLLTDSKLEIELLKMTKGSSEYITPCQVADNAQTDAVVRFDSRGGAGTESSKKTSTK